MKRHPVTVRRRSYRGKDPRKRVRSAEYNRVAARVEDYLRTEMERLPEEHGVQVFLSFYVASSINEPVAVVTEVISSIDAGSNGVTLWKGDYDLALEAMRSS